MHVDNEKGSPLPRTARFEMLLNFCKTVVRSEDEHLKQAMDQYEAFLAGRQRG